MNAPERDLLGEARRARVASTVRGEVRALGRYEVAQVDGWIKLDAMEDPYGLPAELAIAIGKAVERAAINRYPDGDARGVKAALREAFALPDDAGILVGNGSDEVIQIVTAAVVRAGDAVLAPDPSFVMYRRNALMMQARFCAVALRGDFSLDEGAMLDAIARERPALVWLAYPNNPTGNLFHANAVARIAQAAPGLVVVDEAYYAYADDSFLPRVREFANVVVVRTVSKIGMAGLRLGYAVGHTDWIGEFDKLRPPYNVNALTQAALPLLLAHRDVFAQHAATIRAERERLAAQLAALEGVHVYPSQTNFVVARVPDANAWFAALRNDRILVKNLHGWHAVLANCLRITVGTPAENDALMDVLRDCARSNAR